MKQLNLFWRNKILGGIFVASTILLTVLVAQADMETPVIDSITPAEIYFSQDHQSFEITFRGENFTNESKIWAQYDFGTSDWDELSLISVEPNEENTEFTTNFFAGTVSDDWRIKIKNGDKESNVYTLKLIRDDNNSNNLEIQDVQVVSKNIVFDNFDSQEIIADVTINDPNDEFEKCVIDSDDDYDGNICPNGKMPAITVMASKHNSNNGGIGGIDDVKLKSGDEHHGVYRVKLLLPRYLAVNGTWLVQEISLKKQSGGEYSKSFQNEDSARFNVTLESLKNKQVKVFCGENANPKKLEVYANTNNFDETSENQAVNSQGEILDSKNLGDDDGLWWKIDFNSGTDGWVSGYDTESEWDKDSCGVVLSDDNNNQEDVVLNSISPTNFDFSTPGNTFTTTFNGSNFDDSVDVQYKIGNEWKNTDKQYTDFISSTKLTHPFKTGNSNAVWWFRLKKDGKYSQEKSIQLNYNPPQKQCNDGIDNDRDGKTDYPDDPGCDSSEDDDENNVDTLKPVIILNGSEEVQLTVGDTWTDPGVTAHDNVDGDVTSNIVISGDTVNTNTLGIYHITYNVKDSAGNEAVEKTRAVTIGLANNICTNTSDCKIVIGTRSGDYYITVEKNNGNSWDLIGRRISTLAKVAYASMAISSKGIPYIVYIENSNFTPVIKKFNGTEWENVGNVFDIENIGNIISPMIVLNSDDVPYVAYSVDGRANVKKFNGTEWEVVGKRNFSNYNMISQISISIAIDQNDVPYVLYDNDVWRVKKFNGTEWVNEDAGITWDELDGFSHQFLEIGTNTYYTKYDEGILHPVTRVVLVKKNDVVDVTSPIITTNGAPTVKLTVGDIWTDPGVTAHDDVDGDVTSSVVIGGDTVDTNTPGTYHITYNVKDSTGNQADEVTRTIIVSSAIVENYTQYNAFNVTELKSMSQKQKQQIAIYYKYISSEISESSNNLLNIANNNIKYRDAFEASGIKSVKDAADIGSNLTTALNIMAEHNPDIINTSLEATKIFAGLTTSGYNNLAIRGTINAMQCGGSVAVIIFSSGVIAPVSFPAAVLSCTNFAYNIEEAINYRVYIEKMMQDYKALYIADAFARSLIREENFDEPSSFTNEKLLGLANSIANNLRYKSYNATLAMSIMRRFVYLLDIPIERSATFNIHKESGKHIGIEDIDKIIIYDHSDNSNIIEVDKNKIIKYKNGEFEVSYKWQDSPNSVFGGNEEIGNYHMVIIPKKDTGLDGVDIDLLSRKLYQRGVRNHIYDVIIKKHKYPLVNYSYNSWYFSNDNIEIQDFNKRPLVPASYWKITATNNKTIKCTQQMKLVFKPVNNRSSIPGGGDICKNINGVYSHCANDIYVEYVKPNGEFGKINSKIAGDELEFTIPHINDEGSWFFRIVGKEKYIYGNFERATEWEKFEIKCDNDIVVKKVLDVPYLDQKEVDKGWTKCLPTSVTMMLEYIGMIESDESKETINYLYKKANVYPKKLAQLLSLSKISGGYDQQVYVYHSADNGKYFKKGEWNKNEIIRKIKKEIDAGFPVIFGTDFPRSGASHYVVIIGYDGDAFIVNDPYGLWGGLGCDNYHAYIKDGKVHKYACRYKKLNKKGVKDNFGKGVKYKISEMFGAREKLPTLITMRSLNTEQDSAMKLNFKEAYVKGYNTAKINSPVELQSMNSFGNITGVINNRIVEDIPLSVYDEEIETISLPSSKENYKLKLVAIGNGTYGFTATSVVDGVEKEINVDAAPVKIGEVHEYAIDWDAVKENRADAVKIKVDKDGDGNFEREIKTTAEFDGSVFEENDNSIANSSNNSNNNNDNKKHKNHKKKHKKKEKEVVNADAGRQLAFSQNANTVKDTSGVSDEANLSKVMSKDNNEVDNENNRKVDSVNNDQVEVKGVSDSKKPWYIWLLGVVVMLFVGIGSWLYFTKSNLRAN